MKVIAYVPELNKEAEVELDNRAVYDAYREQLLQFRMEDAEAQMEDAGYDPQKFTQDDYREMVRRFEKRQDCNIDENSVWQSIVNEYAEEKGMA